MAYMNQEKKKEIRIELKKVVPSNWKWSLAIRNHSTIVFTVASAPAELMIKNGEVEEGHRTINNYYIDNEYSGKLLEIFKQIVAALNLDNHNNSDIMTDYFDVGHYVTIQLGKWNKPFLAI